MDLKTKLKTIPDTLWGQRHHDAEDCTSDPWMYPLNLDFMLENPERYFSPCDDNGIPMRIFPNKGALYIPTRIQAYALANWNMWKKTGIDQNKVEFDKAIEWLLSNHVDGQWLYHFDWTGLSAPWGSAMAQGEGISALCRAATATDNNKNILQVIESARTTLHKSLNDGGFISYLKNTQEQFVFLEEYPHKNEPMHVLNGCLFAVTGLIDLLRLRENEEDRKLLNQLIATLQANIHRWDMNGWSTYDLMHENSQLRNICTLAYHVCHITQLRYVSTHCDADKLQVQADIWNKNSRKTSRRIQAIIRKILYRLLRKS